jgi:hypothetical protein
MAYWPPTRGEVAEPGLRRTPGERVNSEGFRGFKSPPLRQAVLNFLLSHHRWDRAGRESGSENVAGRRMFEASPWRGAIRGGRTLAHHHEDEQI